MSKEIPKDANLFEFLRGLDKITLVDMVMLGRSEKHIRAIYKGAKKAREAMK